MTKATPVRVQIMHPLRQPGDDVLNIVGKALEDAGCIYTCSPTSWYARGREEGHTIDIEVAPYEKNGSD